MDALTIRQAQASEPDVHALLMTHHALMHSTSPEESCHVMDPGSLDEAGAVLLAARDGGQLLGVGAVKVIGPGQAELKSMHTTAQARGRGVGRAILTALIEQARGLGATRLSLETGSAAQFAPARALYEAQGFTYCDPFGGYGPDPLSVFMTRAI